jgi:hypothetical protein
MPSSTRIVAGEFSGELMRKRPKARLRHVFRRAALASLIAGHGNKEVFVFESAKDLKSAAAKAHG